VATYRAGERLHESRTTTLQSINDIYLKQEKCPRKTVSIKHHETLKRSVHNALHASLVNAVTVLNYVCPSDRSLYDTIR